jgi:hypothetical protein
MQHGQKEKKQESGAYTMAMLRSINESGILTNAATLLRRRSWRLM